MHLCWHARIEAVGPAENTDAVPSAIS
jgi:hypothetical protein